MKIVILSLGLSALALATVSRAFTAGDPSTDEEKTLYAIGASIGSNLSNLRLTEAELEFVKAGLTDVVLNRPKKVDPEACRTQMQDLAKARATLAADENKKAGKAFIDKAVAEQGAERKPSGLAIKMIKDGTGESPKATDKVKVHYTGTLIDGTVFDSTVEKGEPATFSLNGVVPAWTEGLQLMKVGGKAKLFAPSDLGFGDRGRPKIPPGATLVLEVELLEIVK